MLSIEQTLGLTVKITTILDSTITGTVYAYTPALGLVTVRLGDRKGADLRFRIVKTEFIKSLSVVGASKGSRRKPQLSTFTRTQPAIHPVPVLQMELRLQLRLAAPEAGAVNRGASKDGQALFAKLHRAMPQVAWDGDSIVVLGETRVQPPYALRNVAAMDGGKANPLVQKIVAGFWDSRKGG